MYDYGKCETCDTPLEEKNIQQDFWIKDKLVVIEKVPAGVCPQFKLHMKGCPKNLRDSA